MMKNQPMILLIMGTGRSGSTIMDVVLSNSEGVIGCGELGHIFEDAFRDDIICSCEKKASQCGFWGKVVDTMALGDKEVKTIIDVFHRVEWHSYFFKTFFGAMSQSDRAVYRDVNSRLFQAIQSVSGARVVVDSSKYPGRASGLKGILGDNVRIIYLTRNPDGLMTSFRKSGIEQNSKTPFQVFAYYCAINLMARCVSLVAGRMCLHVRYEDFIQFPVEQLERIENWAGIDLSRSKKIIAENGELSVSHIMRGNRLRKAETVRFRNSLSSVGKMGVGTKFYCALMKIIKALLRI